MEANAQSRRDLLSLALGAGAGGSVVAAASGLYAAEARHDAKNPRKPTDSCERSGRVIVTPEGPTDGGHFGKHTPGTKTAGLQEAFDYAKANRKDVYVAGGAMPKAFTAGSYYQLDETLRIPWMQDFRLDGGEYNLVYTKPAGAAVVIDSQMNCRYKFGKIICAKSDGPVVHLKPETKGPDNFSVITATVFDFNVVIGAGGAWPGDHVRGKGTGVFLDPSTGGIHYNKISSIETVGCDRGIHLGGRGVAHNEIHVGFAHICNTHLRLGDPGDPSAFNRITMNFVDSEGIPGSTGVEIFGRQNLLTLNVARTAKGRNVVFEADARDNLVLAINLPNGITNRATTPTNRIISCRSVGFNLDAPPVPPFGEDAVNRHPHAVEVLFLTAGKVSDWTVTDAAGTAQTVSAGISVGQTLTLQPGERIRFRGTTAPTWRWKGLG